MRFNSLALVSSFFLSGLLLACGGGGNTPPVTPLSITTTSLPSGQTTVAYSTTLAATGGTAPYSWSVKTGTLPAGLSLSTAGVIAGTPTAAGSANVTVQVSDSAMTPQTAASGSLALAISGGMLTITTTTAAIGTVGTAYNFQMQATGGVPPYTWATGSGASLPAGLSLSTAGVVSGTPTQAGAFSPSIAVTDETGSNTLSAPVNFTINPAGTPLPDGNYAFQFNGNAPNGSPVAINGAFAITRGAVGPGLYSENEVNLSQPLILQPFAGGAVSVASNGLGQLVLNLKSGSNITFALAVPASALTAGSDSDIRIIEFDDTTGSGMRGSGVLKTANFNTAPTFKGGYAFGFRGYDTHSQPEAIVGSFQADGSGNITSGSVDINDNGTMTSFTTVTGAYNVGTGNISGLITLKFGGDTLNYDYYQVSPTELLATSSDMTTTTIPMVSGLVLQQTGTLSNASFTGANVLEMTGAAVQNALYIPDITLGLFTSDGKGNVTAGYDEFKSSLLPPQTYTATYAVNAGTGRAPVTSSGAKAILYLVSNTKAFVLGTDTSTSSGLVEAQSGAPFTNASLKGNYLGGTIPWPALNVVSLVAADGNGNAQFTSDLSGPTGLMPNVSVSGTYSVDKTGRAALTVTGDPNPAIFYVVSPTRAVFLSGDGGGFLSSFEQ